MAEEPYRQAGDEDGQVAIAELPRIAIVNRANCQCQHHSLILSEVLARRKRPVALRAFRAAEIQFSADEVAMFKFRIADDALGGRHIRWPAVLHR
jgi:hypothetical protein